MYESAFWVYESSFWAKKIPPPLLKAGKQNPPYEKMDFF